MFTVAAMLTSILAAAILYSSASLAYYAISDPPFLLSSATAHDDFHIVEEAGFSLMGAILLLLFAWTSQRKGRLWGFWVLVIAGLPVGVLPPLAYQMFGPWHSYVLYLPILWLLSIAAGGAGLVVKRWRHALGPHLDREVAVEKCRWRAAACSQPAGEAIGPCRLVDAQRLETAYEYLLEHPPLGLAIQRHGLECDRDRHTAERPSEPADIARSAAVA